MLSAYAVVQTTLELPDVEKLKRAFTGLKKFTPADAHIIGRDAFGILVKNLDDRDAAGLQGALRTQGIETVIVPMSELPPMPPGKNVRRVDCLPEALEIYDPLGRAIAIEWKHVMLVAAGNVRVQEFRTVTSMTYSNPLTRDPYDGPSLPPESRTREESVFKPRLEILLSGGVQRFQIESGKALFNYLGERRTKTELENFTLLVRDLLHFAPHALPNRGAFLLKQEPPQLFSYPSKNAFSEEIIWLLWKRQSGK